MSKAHRWLLVLALVASPVALAAGDYVGLLRPTTTAIAIPEPGFYWPSGSLFRGGLDPTLVSDNFKLKLGYRYSRFFSLETGFADIGQTGIGASLYGSPSRTRGFSLDTVGTLPIWKRAAIYGRVGAWRYDGAAAFLSLGDSNLKPGAGLRYGLGLKYDFSRRLGLKAEMEHVSPLDRWGTRDPDTDQLTVGVSWRF